MMIFIFFNKVEKVWEKETVLVNSFPNNGFQTFYPLHGRQKIVFCDKVLKWEAALALMYFHSV